MQASVGSSKFASSPPAECGSDLCGLSRRLGLAGEGLTTLVPFGFGVGNLSLQLITQFGDSSIGNRPGQGLFVELLGKR